MNCQPLLLNYDHVFLVISETHQKFTDLLLSDSDHMQDYLERVLKLRVVTSPTGSGPHFDLAVMGRANHFVGNCISSFTGMVTAFNSNLTVFS